MNIAEMIAEMGKGFLGAGDTIEERQKRLDEVCAAWNMACQSSDFDGKSSTSS